jgi:ABC-type Fe3+/spermidine/putrescine transport system ATPase subunit
MHGVQIQGVSFQYDRLAVLREVSLEAEQGQLVALVGPSGCGKTTLLKLVGGYLGPTAGRVLLRGRDVTPLPPELRNSGMVFQNYALFPHLSARGNVAFGLAARGVPRAERDRRVEIMLDRVGITESERSRRPGALSGGQQQRVALARALVIQPDVLLLDEPLASLDRELREELRAELRALQCETGVTTILVTHDQEEALAISDEIGVLAGGRILQVGSPGDVYAHPRTPFVARFLAAANLFDGKLVGGQGGTAVMVRPEDCTLDPVPRDGLLIWPGRIAGINFLGAEYLVEVRCENAVPLRVRSRAAAALHEHVTVGIPRDKLWTIPDSDPLGLACAGV